MLLTLHRVGLMPVCSVLQEAEAAGAGLDSEAGCSDGGQERVCIVYGEGDPEICFCESSHKNQIKKYQSIIYCSTGGYLTTATSV